MGEAIRTFVIVSVLAVAVWVFAEAESLSTREVNARVELVVSPANRENLRVRMNGDESSQVQLELRGPRSALDRVQRDLEGSISITPAAAGLNEDGPFTLDLGAYLQSLEPIQEANVEVVSVRPPTMSGELIRLKTVDGVPIVVEASGLELEASPTVSPETTRVRVPASLSDGELSDLVVLAQLGEAQVSSLQPGEPVSLSAELRLPASWRGRPDVQLLGPTAATVGLTVRSTRAEAMVEATLWTTLPAAQAGDYELAVDLGERVFDIGVVGPADAVARIESGEWPIVAAVALLPDELLEATVSKELRWFVREGGGLRALPPGVDVRSDRQSVTVTITPAEQR